MANGERLSALRQALSDTRTVYFKLIALGEFPAAAQVQLAMFTLTNSVKFAEDGGQAPIVFLP